MSEPHADHDAEVAEGTSRRGWQRLAVRLEISRAVIYALLLRGWQLLAGGLSVLLIAHSFSADVQGYYYTFSSLMTLQAFFELGCAQVVTNVASHEWSRLNLDAEGRICGAPAAQSRLISLGRLLFKLYGGAFLLFVVIVGVGGELFLTQQPTEGVSWRAPWVVLVLLTAFLLWTLPFNALLEGCHQVTAVHRFRLIQAVCANFVVWTALLLRVNLWVAVAATATRLACELYLIAVRYRRFYKPFLSPPKKERINWRTELWPLQWRLGLQSAVGSFAASFFVLVMFPLSKAVAGRMGMTWMMMFAVQAGAMAWIQTRIPRFGALIARREFAELDRIYRKLVIISMAVVLMGGIFLCLLILGLNRFEFPIAQRVLPPYETGVFMLAIAVLHLADCHAAYLRAHKKDPLFWVNILSYILTILGVWRLGSRFGPIGAAYAYLAVSLLITTPAHMFLWRRCRRDWHGKPA